MTVNRPPAVPSDRDSESIPEAEVQRRMDFADAALGAAGHEVTDPELRELRAKAIRGEITVEQAIAASLEHIDAQ